MATIHGVDHESIVRSSSEQNVRAQSNDVGVRVRIAVRLVAVRIRGWDWTVAVRVVGMIVIVSRVLVAVALANPMRMRHLDGRIGASHVNERNGNDQQTLEDGSHSILG